MANIEKLAIQTALANPIQKLPRMAAVLITPDGDIFIGRNQFKTHPLQARFSRNPMSLFLHAEIDVLVKFQHWGGGWVDGSRVFVARVLKNGSTALAKPCSGCLGALLHYGITDIRWTV